MRSVTRAWAIALVERPGFIGRYWGLPSLAIHPNFTGYRTAVFETRREARATLDKVRIPYGFPKARVVRVRVIVTT